MPYEFDWVDAFSDKPFGGNGCAVVYGAQGMSDELCMAITRETGLVECTFLGPSDKADFHVRYFLASAEIPFAGHPTVATVASLVDRGLIEGETATLETGAGIIPVEIKHQGSAPPLITMTQVAPSFGSKMPADLVAAVGGISPEDIIGEPQVVSTGLPFAITLLKDQEVLKKAWLNRGALEHFRTVASDGFDGRVMEPFWVTLEGATDQGHTFSRLLLPPPMPAEDPFTGSATGAMAAYLWSEGYLNETRFVAEQGHWLGRPGRALVEVLGERNAIEGVRVGGQGYVLMRGYLNL